MSPSRWPDIPTALTEDESTALERFADDRYVLEAGALLGYSTIVMARVAAHVVSVDPHCGYPLHQPQPTLEPYMANLDAWGMRDFVTPIVGKLEDVLPFLQPERFDFVFFDLTGEYQDTLSALHSIEHWLTGGLVSVAVHDCGHPDWPGVEDAVWAFAEETGIGPRQIDRLAVFIP